jgi:hypothetical protein
MESPGTELLEKKGDWAICRTTVKAPPSRRWGHGSPQRKFPLETDPSIPPLSQPNQKNIDRTTSSPPHAYLSLTFSLRHAPLACTTAILVSDASYEGIFTVAVVTNSCSPHLSPSSGLPNAFAPCSPPGLAALGKTIDPLYSRSDESCSSRQPPRTRL